MGRKAGVAAEETRAALLRAAASVFARRGYDGASISEITAEAGLTSGSVYAHYGSKAELFFAALQAYASRDIEQLLGRPDSELADALASVGSTYDRREPVEASLLLSAIVASRNHSEVAALLVRMLAGREDQLRAVIKEAQSADAITAEASPEALARLALMIALGSLVVGGLGLDGIEHPEWIDVIDRLVGAFRA